MTTNDTSYFISEPNCGGKIIPGGNNTFEFLKLTNKNLKFNYTDLEITNRLENTKPKTK